jgi:hypothetical protein
MFKSFVSARITGIPENWGPNDKHKAFLDFNLSYQQELPHIYIIAGTEGKKKKKSPLWEILLKK